MKHFKHAELVETYHVSLRTVHNWIDSAKQGKVGLKLHKTDGRTYIADTEENAVILRQLAEKGKKFRNALYDKEIEPKPEFYSLYNKRQILDIITNLTVHREIPRQYNYFNGGAANWERFALHMWSRKQPISLKVRLSLSMPT